MAYPSFKCPKCGRLLKPSGELSVGDVTVATYQCDECLRTVKFLGESVEVALTFAVNQDGQAFDPADPEDRLRF